MCKGIINIIKDISRYAGSAREALERRSTLVDIIGKNEQKLAELRKQKIDVRELVI